MSIGFDGSSVWYPWFRLYVYALLRRSRIFPSVGPFDESLHYEPLGFTDIWKGNYHGEQVCIKAIRARSMTRLEEIRRVRGSFYTRG